MSRLRILALSEWAHHSWFPRGQRASTEPALAAANASLIARFPRLSGMTAVPDIPRAATLPRPAYAKVLRVTAAFARACSLRKAVSAAARERLAVSIAPRIVYAVQRDPRGERDDADLGVILNLFDRGDMTAAGLCIAMHALDDADLRILMALRLPHALAQRAGHFVVGELSVLAARDLLEAAYMLTRGEPC